MESDLWWTRVKIDLFQKKLLRWVIDEGGKAGAGEIIPDVTTDPEGYSQWAECYTSVKTSLHVNLRGMLEVVLADPRYIALGEFGSMLDRVRVIRDVYADYDLSTIFLDDEDDGIVSSTAAIVPIPDSSLPSTYSNNTHKRPAPAASTNQTTKIARLTPSSLPHSATSSIPLSSTLFDRVYRAPSKINNQTRRDQCKAVMEPDTWGQRCSICGIPDGDGDGGGHRTYACTNLTFATANPDPVLVKFIKKPRDALVVQTGEKAGRTICYAWNTRRTKDGRCYEKDCRAQHCCSLCLKDDHRAWDCDTREYLPTLPPRPKSMVPANVEDCWRLYNGTK